MRRIKNDAIFGAAVSATFFGLVSVMEMKKGDAFLLPFLEGIIKWGVGGGLIGGAVGTITYGRNKLYSLLFPVRQNLNLNQERNQNRMGFYFK